MALDKLRLLFNSCRNIAFFGGAGVSTESGIPDFKSPGGVYSESCTTYSPEEILHKNFFYKHPDLFYQFYFSRMVHSRARPNVAHMALASMERIGRLTGVVTQNIDGLHQQAGSQRVAELHGSVYRNHCIVCNTAYPLSKMLETDAGVPKCHNCGGVLKPGVVLYGEQLPETAVNDAIRIISGADCLIVGGTSLTVYPAASFLEYFRGKYLVLINRDETPYDSRADLIIRDAIGRVLGEAVFSCQ